MAFDVAATAYDAFMGRYSARLAAPFADFAGVRAGGPPGRRVLDVGCGPGALTATLVDRLGPAGVAAVDPSEPFVLAARGRLPGVDVRRASAEALPFADETFESALAQLVVHFMADPVAGLREMARVTRQGGSVAACVWDHAGGEGPLGAFWAIARELDPDVTDEAELPGARTGHLAELLGAAGLVEVVDGRLEADLGHPTFADWWSPFELGVGPAGAYVAGLQDRRRAALRDACRARLGSGPFTVRAVAWAARGIVSGTGPAGA